MFGGRNNKEQGRTLNQRSSSHAQPWHHPLKTLAQPGGKWDIWRDVEEWGYERERDRNENGKPLIQKIIKNCIRIGKKKPAFFFFKAQVFECTHIFLRVQSHICECALPAVAECRQCRMWGKCISRRLWGLPHTYLKPRCKLSLPAQVKVLFASLLALNRSEQEVNIHFVDFAHVWLCPHLTSSSTKCSSHPSPVRAQQAWMCHWWSLTEVSWRLWEISATDMQPFTSCLLAKINSPAFLKSFGRDKRNQKRRL